MNRRDFLTASCLTGAIPLAGLAESYSGRSDEGRQYLELVHYHQLTGSKRAILNDFLADVAIPAMNRIGIGPIGAFSVVYGQNTPSLYVLVPHDTIESVLTSGSRLLEDEDYRKEGAVFHDVPLSDPAYVRMEKSLMLSFTHMPKVEAPQKVEGESRIYELRTYESHSEKAAKKKIEMFNEGGEIQIFRDTGLHPVFFGETLFGPRMPNLTYMLSFRDMEERDRNWGVFREDPAWGELSGKEEYRDTVSNISDVILRATNYSQI